MTDTVIRWSDGYNAAPPLTEQLRSRPGQRGIIVEGLTHYEVGEQLRRIRDSLGDEFTVDAQPTDDGEYGVIYEITACYETD